MSLRLVHTTVTAMKPKILTALICYAATAAFGPVEAGTIELYVDPETQQIFAQPGAGRVRLGTFVQTDAVAGNAPPSAVAEPTVLAGTTAPGVPGTKSAQPATHASAGAAVTPPTSDSTTVVGTSPVTNNSLTQADKKWYERLSLRGYTQLRYNQGVGGNADMLNSPGDKFIGDPNGFGLRRARVVISGDLNEYVYLYLQPDFASSPSISVSGAPGAKASSSTGNFAQLRDAYADIFFDQAHEYRIRTGQSKVPYGFENMQSSQNRIAFDRTDALNYSVKDERDMGLFFYYSPREIAKRFQYLVKSGLKGSGDYGMFGAGIYNGQGANRANKNREMHKVVHFTYPFKLDNGQFIEVGADAYKGRFKVSTESYALNGATIKPTVISPGSGFDEYRVATHFVYYPQPFGVQAEWAYGRGPELNVGTGIIENKKSNGGYVQFMYRMEGSPYGVMVPYVKWQSYHGGAKFETNAPRTQVNETEVGVEWQPWPVLELTTAYSHMSRTNLTAAPYPLVAGDLLRLQLQINY